MLENTVLIAKKIPRSQGSGALAQVKLLSHHIDGAKLARILGIGLGVVSDLLTLGQSAETLGLDSGEVDEHVAAAIIVGDEAEALFVVKPFDCAVIHNCCTS